MRGDEPIQVEALPKVRGFECASCETPIDNDEDVWCKHCIEKWLARVECSGTC